MAYPSPRERSRWLSVYNDSGETIPGFALLALDPLDGDDFFTQTVVERQVVWRVVKSSAWHEAAQNSAMHLFNGPTPIPAKGYGKATADAPAQVMHDGTDDRLPNGRFCGPKADSWYVWSSGSAWTCISHDAGKAGGDKKTHTVWVRPPTITAGTQYFAYSASGTVSAATSVPLSTEEYLRGPTLSSDETILTFTAAGLWHLSIAATLTSPDANEGDPLGLAIYQNDVESYLKAWRSFELDTDYPSGSLRTAENVAVSGLVEIAADDTLDVRATATAAQTTYSSFVFTGHLLHVFDDRTVSAGDLSYGT